MSVYHHIGMGSAGRGNVPTQGRWGPHIEEGCVKTEEVVFSGRRGMC